MPQACLTHVPIVFAKVCTGMPCVFLISLLKWYKVPWWFVSKLTILVRACTACSWDHDRPPLAVNHPTPSNLIVPAMSAESPTARGETRQGLIPR
eukprot:7556888-Heterocapsa_arctica.AAC.2